MCRYLYGKKDLTGGERGLESALQRLDFGPAEMKAEGVVGDAVPVWQLGEWRERVLQMVVESTSRVTRVSV